MKSIDSTSDRLANPRVFPLFGLVVIGVLASLAAPVLAKSAKGIAFDAEKVTLRAAHGATHLEYSFRFENKSGEHVALEKIEVNCGCLKGKALFEIVDPGANGEIQGLMDLKGLHGTVAKSMWLRFTNGERHELVAEVVIPATLVMEPVDLVWKKGEKAADQQVVIRVESGPPLEITAVVSNLPQFAVLTETVSPGRHYILHVRPNSTDKDLTAVIQVKTSSKNPRDAIRAVFASITNQGKQAS
jgi:hypothetical protein